MFVVHLITLVTTLVAAWQAIKGRQAAQDAHAAVNGGLDARIDGRVNQTLQKAQVKASTGQAGWTETHYLAPPSNKE